MQLQHLSRPSACHVHEDMCKACDLQHLLACAQVRRRFEKEGGTVLEKTAAEGVVVHPNGVELRLGNDRPVLTGRLLIDCMGNASPLVRQVSVHQCPHW